MPKKSLGRWSPNTYSAQMFKSAIKVSINKSIYFMAKVTDMILIFHSNIPLLRLILLSDFSAI